MNVEFQRAFYEYSKRAKDIPIVFVHGVGLDHKSWQYLLKDFSSRATLTYDLLGHGQTKRAWAGRVSSLLKISLRFCLVASEYRKSY